MTTVRVVVPARNEARSLPALLASVQTAIARARDRGAAWDVVVVVVTDRCTDDTAAIARDHGAVVSDATEAGKVEALRAGFDNAADVHVCVDADVVMGADTLFDLVQTLLTTPTALATCPPLAVPPSPAKVTPLAWALWRYNRARGFSSERLWLSGRCFAVRHVDFPTVVEMTKRALDASASALAGPLLADDVWLSRRLLHHGGAGAIVHVDTDAVVFKPPATFVGMSRTWRRLRREVRRIDVLFPELPGPVRDRAIDMSGRPHSDRVALLIFRAALWLCRAHAWWLDRFATDDDHWPVVAESKAA